MKKIRWTMTVRYMLRQKSACLSMFIVAMLAVTAYLGVNFSAAAMRDNADRYWSETAFRDIEIVSPSLLSEEDMRAIERGMLAGLGIAEQPEGPSADDDTELVTRLTAERDTYKAMHEQLLSRLLEARP